MELYEVMKTTFAARQFKVDPVSDETTYRILENARFAPSGGNRQGWHVIVIKDQAKRDALVPLVRSTMQRYRAQVNAGENPFNTIAPSQVTPEQIATTEVPASLIEGVLGAPLLLLVAVDLKVVASMDSELDRVGVISGASIYPFVWNILTAARNEGLGGTLTTFVTAHEPHVKELFGLPDDHALAALVPIGKPVKQLTKLRRNPVSSFTTVNTFNGEKFVG